MGDWPPDRLHDTDHNPLSLAVHWAFSVPHCSLTKSIFHQFIYKEVMGHRVRTLVKVKMKNIHFFPKMQHAASHPLPPQCGGFFQYWNKHYKLYFEGVFLYPLNTEGTLHDLLNFNIVSPTLRVHIPVAIFCNFHRHITTNLFQILYATALLIDSDSCKANRYLVWALIPKKCNNWLKLVMLRLEEALPHSVEAGFQSLLAACMSIPGDQGMVVAMWGTDVCLIHLVLACSEFFMEVNSLETLTYLHHFY